MTDKDFEILGRITSAAEISHILNGKAIELSTVFGDERKKAVRNALWQAQRFINTLEPLAGVDDG